MKKNVMIKKLINPVLIIFFAAVLRLLPHPPNFAPIAAMALFGGFYLNKKYALIVPLIALSASDLFLGLHNTMVFVYGSFLLTGAIGILFKKYGKIQYIFAAALCSSILFFLITNFGVWLMWNFYPKNFLGLIECYTAAIPFFRNTVLGDLFYTTLFFGSFEFAKTLVARYSIQKN